MNQLVDLLKRDVNEEGSLYLNKVKTEMLFWLLEKLSKHVKEMEDAGKALEKLAIELRR